MSELSWPALLQALCSNDVEFIVVGGVAAILEGVPISTVDLDIVYETSSDNCERLRAAASAVAAIYRDPAGRRIEPTASRLLEQPVNLLMTSAGSLDLLQTVGRNRNFDELSEHAVTYQLDDGPTFDVLALEVLIETKREAGRPKDLAMLPTLEKTLELRKRGQ